MKPRLRIIRPSSREANSLLPERLRTLRAAGYEVLYDDLPVNPAWAYAAAATELRATALTEALCERSSDVVLCARGGYGASDLLPGLDWAKLQAVPAKLLVGFSDVSALHAALYTKLAWPGLHAPMPATELWGKDGEQRDIDQLLALLADWQDGRAAHGTLALQRVAAAPGPTMPEGRAITGKLFGGCFTVLTNLIGTPYFPRDLAGHLVFIEDTGEHPARLLRALNQWLQSGVLRGVEAVIVGHLRSLGEAIPDNAPFVLTEFARRLPVPVWHTPLFGHTSPNLPLMVGADATIANGSLIWKTMPPPISTPQS